MTQPSILPRFATDTNYASGPAAGTPTKVDRGAGARAQGIIGNAAAYAQHDNHERNLVGEHLRSVAALAVDNWGEQISSSAVTFRTSAASPPGRMFSVGNRLAWSIAQGGAAPFAYSDHNGENWAAAGTTGLSFADWSFCFSNGTIVLVIDVSDGTILQTTNLTNWSAAGTVGFGGTMKQAGYFAGADRWIIIGATGGDNFFVSDDNLAGTWTYVAPPANVLADTAVPLDFATSPSEVLIPFSSGRITRSTNGTSWTDALLPNYTGSIVGLSYSSVHALWVCLGTAGKTWYSSNGAVWTEGAVVTGTFTAGGRVAAFGRYWAAAESTGVARWDRDEYVIVPELLSTGAGVAPSDIHMHSSGRLVASHVTAGNVLSFKRSLRVN